MQDTFVNKFMVSTLPPQPGGRIRTRIQAQRTSCCWRRERLAQPRPSNAEPNSQAAAGSGTAVRLIVSKLV